MRGVVWLSKCMVDPVRLFLEAAVDTGRMTRALPKAGSVSCQRMNIVLLCHKTVFEDAIATTALQELNKALFNGV